MKVTPETLADAVRAVNATDEEHLAARDTTRCAICGATPRVECTFGVARGSSARSAWPRVECTFGVGGHPTQFPGKVHVRRLRAYLGALAAPEQGDR